MGLDQWLYRMRKPAPGVADSVRGLDFVDAYRLLSGHDGEPPKGFLVKCSDDPDTSDLEGFAERVTLVEFDTDAARLKADRGVPAEAEYCGGRYGNGFSEMHYRVPGAPHGDDVYVIDIDDDELHRYDVPRDADYWVCDACELRYWRKNYDIQGAVHANHRIDNCGFHDVSDDGTLDEIERLDPGCVIPRLHPGDGIFYHEWY